MSSVLIVLGAVGGVCSLAALMGLGLALAREGRIGMAFVCLGAMAFILFLALLGWEFSDEFWKGRP